MRMDEMMMMMIGGERCVLILKKIYPDRQEISAVSDE